MAGRERFETSFGTKKENDPRNEGLDADSTSDFGVSGKAREVKQDVDCVLMRMLKDGVPLTLNTYLEYAYFGNAPEEIDAEVLADIPEEILSNSKFVM